MAQEGKRSEIRRTIGAKPHLWVSAGKEVHVRFVLPMSPFSMALMSGRSRQSVGGSSLSMPGSSSFSVMAKLEKVETVRSDII
ncbi:hypothetical protein EYF80_016465 [Liparis tanakae]|uniref:Uncharacterized protein n=1 Tax=Liparis tanakae TaxID=230148 RepID=A0A4Z2I7P8_9TELE|nr:hypothetical protein EYF80_016465 [Liparis tanakae]